MNIFEIISAIVLILACVFIVVVVLMKDTKTQMSQSISGTSSDSFFQKNAGRTKEARLNKATIGAVIVFFVLALAVNIINVYGGKNSTESGSSVITPASDTSGSSGTSSGTESSASSDTTSSETSSDTTSSESDSESSTSSEVTSSGASSESGTDSTASATSSAE